MSLRTRINGHPVEMRYTDEGILYLKSLDGNSDSDTSTIVPDEKHLPVFQTQVLLNYLVDNDYPMPDYYENLSDWEFERLYTKHLYVSDSICRYPEEITIRDIAHVIRHVKDW